MILPHLKLPHLIVLGRKRHSRTQIIWISHSRTQYVTATHTTTWTHRTLPYRIVLRQETLTNSSHLNVTLTNAMRYCNTHCNIDSNDTTVSETITSHSTRSQETLTNSNHLNITLTNSMHHCNTHYNIDSTNTTTSHSTTSRDTHELKPSKCRTHERNVSLQHTLQHRLNQYCHIS